MLRWIFLFLLSSLPVFGATHGEQQNPLDIIAQNGFTAVAAHSMTRALSASYSGPLFTVTRGSDSTTTTIFPIQAGGPVNLAAITAFCGVANANTCTYTAICDQISGLCTASNNNALLTATSVIIPPVSFTSLPNGNTIPVFSNQGSFGVSAARNLASTVNIPTGTSPTVMLYAVASSNVQRMDVYGLTDNTIVDGGNGTMFDLAYGTVWGNSGNNGIGAGPWIGVEWENSPFYAGSPTLNWPFVTLLAKTNQCQSYVREAADATTNGKYSVAYSGPLEFGGCHLFSGLSICDGGDGSEAECAFEEGVIVAGYTDTNTDNQIAANIVRFYGPGATPSGSAVNFLTSPSVPSGWTFTRSACTGTAINCTTDAQYTDAAGAAFNTYATNVITANATLGFGSFESRTNALLNSGSPANQSPAITSGYYVAFCNGTGSMTVASGSASPTGTGTIACNSGTFLTLNLASGSGTITVSFSGSVNWADIQTCGRSDGGPTPHIISTSVSETRPRDEMVIGGAAATLMAGQLYSAVVEETTVAWSLTPTALSYYFGSPAGGLLMYVEPQTSPLQTASGVANYRGSVSYINSGPALAVQTRIGAVSAPGVPMITHDGANPSQGHSPDHTQFPYAYEVPGATLELGGSTYSVPSDGFGNIPASNCNCWITQAAFYPYALGTTALMAKTVVGAPLP